MIKSGLVVVAELPEAAEETYLSLVAGPVSQTLDDGEAATLALALEVGAIAIIDERKAIKLAQTRFPDLRIVSTTDLLLSDVVRAVLSTKSLGAFFTRRCGKPECGCPIIFSKRSVPAWDRNGHQIARACPPVCVTHLDREQW